VKPPTHPSDSGKPSTDHTDSGKGSKKGLIAGVSIAGVIVIAGAVIGGFLVWRWWKSNKTKKSEVDEMKEAWGEDGETTENVWGVGEGTEWGVGEEIHDSD
jgi:ABC-type branched-subunit amino acid transport system substrate-binding protein